MSCFLIPVPPDPLSHMNLSSHPPILPGAGPSLVRWIKDVSDGVMTSAATQRAETSLKCMLLENLNHACIAQNFLAYSCSKWCCHGICWRRAFWLVNIASFRDLLSSRNWLKSILSQLALKGILALIIVVCKSFQRQFDPCLDVKYSVAQVSDGPFPWPCPVQQCATKVIPTPIAPAHQGPSQISTVHHGEQRSWEVQIREALDDPDVAAMLEQSERHEKISVWLPLKVTTAGVALKHATMVFDDLHDRFAPMIYKFGFTCNPLARWQNRKYGYGVAPEKWERMFVIYLSPEPWSPAMLEAALINR